MNLFCKTACTLAGFSLLFQGCANRSKLRFDAISQKAGADNYEEAIGLVRKNKSLYGNDSKLLYAMDVGILYHYAGKYDSSIAALSEAVKIHDDLFAKSISNEAAALVTNDNTRPYRGKPYEIILLHEILAFNYLALGKSEDAMVEIRQAQLYLDEVKRKANKSDKNNKEFKEDGMFRYLSSILYLNAKQKDDAAIAAYQSVKAYRDKTSPIPLPNTVANFTTATLKNADRKNDLDELALPPADIDAGGSEIIVIGHAGRAPYLGQNVFWGTWAKDGVLVIHYKDANGKEVTSVLPAPGLSDNEVAKAGKGQRTRSGTTFHIKFAMPEKTSVNSRTRFFTIAGEAAPNPIKTESLTDLDPLLANDLDANFTSILMRTVIRVVLRTYAAEETKSAISGSNPILNLILNIGTDALSDQLEQADTRNWFLLPRTVQIARIPVKPGNHSLSVEAHDGVGATLSRKDFSNIEVKPGEKKFIFYSSLK